MSTVMLMGMAALQEDTGPTCQLPNQSLARVNFGATCYSGIQIGADGNIDALSESNVWVDTGDDWLLTGTNSEVWVETTLNSGTLYSSSATGTRLACTSDTYWRIRDTSSGDGEETASITIELYDASSGGNLLASNTYALDAENF